MFTGIEKISTKYFLQKWFFKTEAEVWKVYRLSSVFFDCESGHLFCLTKSIICRQRLYWRRKIHPKNISPT